MSGPAGRANKKLEIRDVELWYDGGRLKVLHGVTLPVWEHRVTALIGPSGLGKSSLLRILNRTIEHTEGAQVRGSVSMDGRDVFHMPPVALRRSVMLLGQTPMVFPCSIFENVGFGLRYVLGVRSRSERSARVEQALRAVGLWRDLQHRLRQPAVVLSGGQKALLCLARILVMRPDVILMDEPGGALDPVLAGHLEQLIRDLRHGHTLVLVTHNLEQAARVSDFTAFLEGGRVVEFAPTEHLFIQPVDPRTRAYIQAHAGVSSPSGHGTSP